MGAILNDIRDATALVVDVAESSAVEDFDARRDRLLRGLGREHAAAGAIARPYTVTAWDEFQTIAFEWSRIPSIILDLRLVFSPLQLYVGVGHGPVSGWDSERPMNESLHGPAFERAREALDVVKSGRGKYPRLTAFRSGDAQRDALLDLAYGLHDTLVQQISDRQWETMAAAREAESQDALARRFGVEPSTITRNLKRGHYWQLRHTAEALTSQMATGLLAL